MSDLHITCYELGQQGANAYLLVDQALDAIIIDPGDDATLLTEELSRKNAKLKAILLTHGHFDHLLGVFELLLATGAPFYLHPADQFLLARAAPTAQHFTHQATDPVPQNFLPLADNQVFPLEGGSLQVMHTPGHTPGSVCFSVTCQGTVWLDTVPAKSAVVSGDTLLPGENTDLSHSYSSKSDWRKSIKKLADLPENVLVLPGHGECLPLAFYQHILKKNISN